MKQCYYLPTCSTCNRIIDQLGIRDSKEFEFIDIKSNGIKEYQLDKMKGLAGTYEALFSRRAMKYKSMGLGSMLLSEVDYKQNILNEYTFLKRPVFIIDNEIFIGSSKKVIESLETRLNPIAS